MTPNLTHRRKLLEIYQAALQAVVGDRVVTAWFKEHPLEGEWAVLAIGKAAGAMVQGARAGLGEGLREVLVITKAGHSCLARPGESWLEGGHPVPDVRSLAAGSALLDFLEHLPEGRSLLVLLSGGASALVEVLPDGVDGGQLAEVNAWLLASGLDIAAINQVRKGLSLIKGGRLASYLGQRSCVQLLISDVPGDDPRLIGSAPLLASGQTAPALPGLPEWITRICQQAPPLPDDKDPGLAHIESHLIANNRMACEAAANRAAALGLAVYWDQRVYEGDVVQLADEILATVRDGPPGVYIRGGEATVRLPPNPGRGGRNQHLVLLMAQRLAGVDNILLLVAGTDGSDGPTSDAGAIVDGQTVLRAEQEGFSASWALAHADAGRLLEASGDLIATGPSGSNVMDLLIMWKF